MGWVVWIIENGRIDIKIKMDYPYQSCFENNYLGSGRGWYYSLFNEVIYHIIISEQEEKHIWTQIALELYNNNNG